jgi:hypothetical protein
VSPEATPHTATSARPKVIIKSAPKPEHTEAEPEDVEAPEPPDPNEMPATRRPLPRILHPGDRFEEAVRERAAEDARQAGEAARRAAREQRRLMILKQRQQLLERARRRQQQQQQSQQP